MDRMISGIKAMLKTVINAVFPRGTRRRFVAVMACKAIRHPGRVLSKLSVERLKKLIRGIKSGDTHLLETQVTNCIGGTEIVCTPVKIEEIPTDDRGEKVYEKIYLKHTDTPLVTIVIPAYNQFDYTYLCLKCIAKNSGEDIPYEVILADDCSNDQTRMITEFVEGLRVVRTDTNLRFLKNCNHAASEARGAYLLFLNNDTQVQENWLEPLIRLLESSERIGMVGSKLIYPDGRLQEAGGILWRDASAWNYGHGQDPSLPEFNYVKDVDYISGASILIRRALWEQVGGFDERFAPAYCEDSDLALMVRSAGFRVVYQPLSVVVHFEGISNGTETDTGLKAYQVYNRKTLAKKWAKELASHSKNGENVFLARDCSAAKKTMLFVDHYVPTFDKDAGSRTVFAYLKMFVEHGYNVKFIGDNFYQSEPYTTILQQMGVEVLYGSWYANNWKQWLKANAAYFDYAFLNRPHIAVKYIDFIKENTHAKVVYYGHDLHFLRTYREYELVGEERLLQESERWAKKEFELMHKADCSYYPSQEEIREIHRRDERICVRAIPAYLFDHVDDVDFRAEERRDLLFVGGFSHLPNVDAVKWLAGEIMPLLREEDKDIRVHIVGSNMPQEIKNLGSEGLVMEDTVPEERLRQLYQQCRVCIVPLRYGAGVKGKVVESMRYGLPVVTTSCGAEGIVDAQDVLTCADTAPQIAHAVAALYHDAQRLSRLSQAGIAYVREHYAQKNAVEALGQEFDL